MSNHPKWGNELLSEFSCLNTTITTKIVSPHSIKNAIASFYMMPLLPVTLRLVFLNNCNCFSVLVPPMPSKPDTASHLDLPFRVLARPYLITLYVIFQIHLNFPIRSRCVVQAIIHRKKTWIVLWLLENKNNLFVLYNSML